MCSLWTTQKIRAVSNASCPQITASRFPAPRQTRADAIKILEGGHNVAVVFAGNMPEAWNGYRVINGDEHDLRHLDPKGVVVGLTPKGNKAKRDTSGFVVRQAA